MPKLKFKPVVEESYDSILGKLFNPTDRGFTSNARTVTLQVTDDCNLACTYCYQIHKQKHIMPIEVGKKFLDELLDGKYDHYCEYDKTEGIILDFIGGEPFLAIDLISELTDYFIEGLIRRNHRWQYRYRISLCSNGVLYFSPKVQEYIRKHHQHLSFSISIDGNKELHDSCRVFPDGSGSYDVAISAVQHYMKTYNLYTMGSKMTLAPENIMHTRVAVESLFDQGYRIIHLNCVYEEGWNMEHAKILYQQLKELADYMIESGRFIDSQLSIFDQSQFGPKDENDLQNWCGGTGAMLAVDWKGDLYPCLRYMESSLGTDQPPMIIGNVERGILTLPHECDIADCLNCIDRRTQSTDECFNCPIAGGCSWCSAYNYQKFGTPDHRATFICCMHKARALANAYYWNKVYRIMEPDKRFKIFIPKDWAMEIIDESEWELLKVLESAN